MRRAVPALLIGLGLVLLLSYVAYTQRIVTRLRAEAQRDGRMYARVYSALAAPEPESQSAALLDLAGHIRDSGVPVVLTDTTGRVTAAVNLPFKAPLDDIRVAAYVTQLDGQNPPVAEPEVGTVHFGNTPLVEGLRVIPLLQVATAGVLVLAGAYVLVTRSRAERERIWAGMAREAAHQLGTPLSSLGGWVELLEEHGENATAASVAAHVRGDLERLERVASRFERIGRPPRLEDVDVAGLVERLAHYYRARVPTLAHTVHIVLDRPMGSLLVSADPVLIEWALEAFVKNAVDALGGRGGTVCIAVMSEAERGVRLRVSDDGPGIPRELRSRIFDAGFTTKSGGWGLGLALARRIIEENHRGRVQLVPTERGATFDVSLS
ncbi:MAG: hypothetical protein NVS1B4_15640 [Gemmatimonadaceae bacterium]